MTNLMHVGQECIPLTEKYLGSRRKWAVEQQDYMQSDWSVKRYHCRRGGSMVMAGIFISQRTYQKIIGKGNSRRHGYKILGYHVVHYVADVRDCFLLIQDHAILCTSLFA
ncbi:hypothetical protein TNCV_4465251 [Trichonephila clavipes]|nr:hypothetical protein TNCV_4465251 [Trichonephila clavipes]